MSQLDIHTLKNGMILLGERIDHVQSVSFHFLLPAGSAVLPRWVLRRFIGDQRLAVSRCGQSKQPRANRGAGRIRDSSPCVGFGQPPEHQRVAGSRQPLAAALELFADMILRPKLDADQFELSRQLAVSELEGLDDDPRQKVMIHLAEQFYPDPYGRSALGQLSELEGLTAETAHRDHSANVPSVTDDLFGLRQLRL